MSWKPRDGRPIVVIPDNSGFAHGDVPGDGAHLSYGETEGMSGTESLVWAGEGIETWGGFQTTAAAYRVRAGGDANDTAAGTGAQSVRLKFLNASGVPVSADLATAGAGASAPTAVAGLRLQSAEVLDAGAYNTSGVGTTGKNAAAIVIETTGGDVVGYIPLGFGTTSRTVYTVPVDHTAGLRCIGATIDGNNATRATVRLWSRDRITTTAGAMGAVELRGIWAGVTSIMYEEHYGLPQVPELTDIWCTVERTAGAGTHCEIEYCVDVRKV